MEAQPQTTPAPAANAGGGRTFPSAFSLFKPSMEALKHCAGVLLALVFSPLVLAIPFGVIVSTMAHSSQSGTSVSPGLAIFAAVWFIVMIIVWSILSPAIVAVQLAGARGEKMDFGTALKVGVHNALRFLGLSIVLNIVLGVGFLLLIIPGVFFMQRFMLSSYFMIDGNLGVFAAMKASANTAKRFSSPVWGLLGVQLLIGLICGIPFIGFIPGIIMAVLYLCAPAVRYYELKKAGA